MTGGGPRTLVPQIDAVIEANAARSEEAAAFERCPQCESGQYKQRPIRS
jgi:hypothetical protein